MNFRYGIEHEVAFINAQGQYADYTNTPFDDFANIIEQLPHYDSDYPMLRVGDAGIKVKRWYIEGFERFADDGSVTGCDPKGIEIRTTIHSSIKETMLELDSSYRLLREKAKQAGYVPALTSYHPWHEVFDPQPPLSEFEIKRRNGSPEKLTANIPMMTQGPDLSLSCPEFSEDEVIYAARKLTAYSPYIIPFTFSSPFYGGKIWDGLSIRTYKRTGARPAAMAFINDESKMLKCSPSLTQKARVPAESGRIEFKAFDSCNNFRLYAALLSLLKGIILDTRLPLASDTPDTRLHQQSAMQGFHNANIKTEAYKILTRAYASLPDEYDACNIEYLFTLLEKEVMPADQMKLAFLQGKSIEEIMLMQC